MQITGKNFSRYAEDNIVRINGLECQVKSVLDDGGYVNSDNKLNITIPYGASTGTVTLTIAKNTVKSEQTIKIPSGNWENYLIHFRVVLARAPIVLPLAIKHM